MRTLILSFWKLLPLVLLVATPALAYDYGIGDLSLDHPWARATPPVAPVAGGYVTIVNGGRAPDRLLAVTSPIAERIEVHELTTVDGVARMRPVDGLVIAPGETIVLKPGSLHLMFLKPTGPLRQGERFPATFVFEKAGAVAVEFTVQGMGASDPGDAEHGAPQQ